MPRRRRTGRPRADLHDPRWPRLRQEAIRRDGGRCRRCGAAALAPEVHHVVPVSRGGAPFDLDNLATYCRPCHQRVHGKRPEATPEEVAEDRRWAAFVSEGL